MSAVVSSADTVSIGHAVRRLLVEKRERCGIESTVVLGVVDNGGDISQNPVFVGLVLPALRQARDRAPDKKKLARRAATVLRWLSSERPDFAYASFCCVLTNTMDADEWDQLFVVQFLLKQLRAPEFAGFPGALARQTDLLARMVECAVHHSDRHDGQRTRLAIAAMDCSILLGCCLWTERKRAISMLHWAQHKADVAPDQVERAPSSGTVARQILSRLLAWCREGDSVHRQLRRFALVHLLNMVPSTANRDSQWQWEWGMYAPLLLPSNAYASAIRKAEEHGDSSEATLRQELLGWLGFAKYNASVSLTAVSLALGAVCTGSEVLLLERADAVGRDTLAAPFVNALTVGGSLAVLARSVLCLLASEEVRQDGKESTCAWMTNVGDDAFRRGEFVAAGELYTITLEAFEQSEHGASVSALCQTLSTRAASYLQEHRYDACVEDCDRALTLLESACNDTGDAHSAMVVLQIKLRVRKGSAECELGLAPEALASYNKAVILVNQMTDEAVLESLLPVLMDMEKVRKLSELLVLKANADALFRARHFNKALDIYSTILAQAPTIVGALSNRSSVLLALGRWDEAIDDCTHALELLSYDGIQDTAGRVRRPVGPCPAHGTVRHNSWMAKTLARRGAAYVKLSDFAKALADFQRASAFDPENESLKQDVENVRSKVS